MTKLVTIDLDSTTYDTSHRHGMIDRTNGTDWLAYSKLCIHDTVIESVANLARLAKASGALVWFVSGRMDGARAETLSVLDRDDIPYDGVMLDDTVSGDHVGEFGSHAAFKVWQVQQLVKLLETDLGQTIDHLFHVDDYSSVKVELERAGIPCICVRTPQEVLDDVGELA